MRWEYRIEMFPHLLDVDARNMLATLAPDPDSYAVSRMDTWIAPWRVGAGVFERVALIRR